ncbi:MAG: hypothetical protein RBS40_15185 [Rhodocyclaceae bacterium]|jgi:hypothetical protein|nr:hypothetical protein [Rhodocyclaceae bacterium]
MIPTHPLDAYTGPIRTRMGAAIGGERAVFRGYDLHRDLRDIHWVELLFFGVTGKRYSPSEIRICNALLTFTSYPDPRIWNNRIAALGGTSRTTGNLAVAAAQAASEAVLFGGQSFYRALDFLFRARAHCDTGGDLHGFVADDLRRHRAIAGFGRPRINEDERVAPMLALLAEEGFDDGPFLRLARRIEEILLTGRWRYRMNYAGLAAAVCGDLGLTPEQYSLVSFPAFPCGMFPCYLEAREKPAGAVMPVTCVAMKYIGASPRHWA